MIIRLYFIGIAILITAIIANVIIARIGLTSWYDFLNYIFDKSSSDIKNIGVLDYLWLFLGYPLVLGLGYLLGDKLYGLIF